MIAIEDLNIRRRGRRDVLLHRFSLHVASGESCALVGPSGAGKTAVLESIAGIRPIEEGRVTISPPVGSTVHRENLITTIWGSGAVDDALTVRQNISMVLRLCGVALPTRATMDSTLRIVELPDRSIDGPASRLTSAQRFALWLAIARLRQTSILLLDDPTPAWTASEVANAIPVIRDFRAAGVTTLLATRDTALASALADRVCVMEEGRKVTEGPTNIVLGAGAAEIQDAKARR